jgi:hypothetical protein
MWYLCGKPVDNVLTSWSLHSIERLTKHTATNGVLWGTPVIPVSGRLQASLGYLIKPFK